jgi:hypothetical protein
MPRFSSLTSQILVGRASGGVGITDYTVINATSPTAFAYLPMPGGSRTFLNYITSFGVTGGSSNDGTGLWSTSYSGTLNFTAQPITTNNYFSQTGTVNFIQGDTTVDSFDWAVIRFSGGPTDFDGNAPAVGAAYFGSESATSGASNGSTVTYGRVWGFSPSLGWVLLYVLDLPGAGAYNHTNGSWFSAGGTVTGNYTVLGKRTEYDSTAITHVGFTVGTV